MGIAEEEDRRERKYIVCHGYKTKYSNGRVYKID